MVVRSAGSASVPLLVFSFPSPRLRPFIFTKNWGCTHARESPISAEHLGCALPARATRFRALQSLGGLFTHKTYKSRSVETPLKFRYARRARVHPRMGTKFRLRPGFRTVCRRRAGRTGQVCHCKQLRVFTSVTSVCECLRACSSVCERAKSRLVAFGRANFFLFGHVWASSIFVILRHSSSFFVILRHSSSFFVPNWLFSGMAGDGRLRQGHGWVRLCSAQLYYKTGVFAVPGNPRIHLRMGMGF